MLEGRRPSPAVNTLHHQEPNEVFSDGECRVCKCDSGLVTCLDVTTGDCSLSIGEGDSLDSGGYKLCSPWNSSDLK